MQEDKSNEKTGFYQKEFTFLDYFFHFGIALNLIVVVLLLWYGLKA